MSEHPYFADFTREEMVANLVSRRDQMAEKVKAFVREIDEANRQHPEWPPLSVDEDGALTRACYAIGLDLATLEAEARR